MAKIRPALIKDNALHTQRMQGGSVRKQDCYYSCKDCKFAQEPRESSTTVQRGRKGRIYCRILNAIRKGNSTGCNQFEPNI